MATPSLRESSIPHWQPPFFPHLSEGFILDEDKALHRYLREPALVCWDQSGNPRKVGVWFGHPDREVREQKYPYLIISLIDVTESTNRTMSGRRFTEAPTVPTWELPPKTFIGDDGKIYNGAGMWNDIWYDKSSYPLQTYAESPIPVQLDYTVRAFSRHPRHDREIFGQFLSRKVNYRYSWLPMGDIDGTNRRLELLSTAHQETMEAGKRLFMSVFTVRVDGFMPAGAVTVVEGVNVIRVLGEQYGYRSFPDLRSTDERRSVISGGWVHEHPSLLTPTPVTDEADLYE